MSNLTSSLTIKVLADTKQAKTAAQALRDIEANAKAAAKAMAGSGASDRFVKNIGELKMQARDIDAVRKAWTDYAKSANLAADSSKWTKAQAASVKTWERQTISALRTVSREQAQFARRQDAAVRKAEAARERRELTPGKLLLGAAAIPAGHRAKEMGKKAVVSAAEFDIGTRKQRVFTDISADDQAGLLRQATRIGQDTQFSNLDVVKAQTKAMQGLPSGFDSRTRAAVAEGLLENVKNYALVMEADLETSSEGLRSYLQAFNKDISTKEKALSEGRKATNQMVRMAKAGGMSDEDVQQFVKFAASSGSTAGLTPEAMMAMAAVARRGGLRGDEFGVAMRSMSSKLVSPTKQGISALGAAGINYSDYVRMPETLDVGAFENHFKRETGKGFTDAVRKKVSAVLGDKAAIGSQSAFIEAITSATQDLFGRTKKGELSATDSKTIAKTARGFHKVSAASVDAQKLMDDVMSSNMSLAQLNAFLTDKHGGKFAITQRQRDEYVATRKQLKAAGDDPDFAKKKADEIMAGLGGSFERLKGSVENLTLSMGQANEAWLKPTIEKVGEALDAISDSSKGMRQGLTAAGLLGGGVSAGAGLYAFMGGGGLAGAARAAMTPFGWAARATGLPGAMAAMANMMAGNPLDIGISADEAARKNLKRRVTEESHKPYGSSRSQDDALKARLAEVGQASVTPKVDASQVDAFGAKAEENGEKAKQALNVTFSPKVDNSSLERTANLLDAISGKISAVNGGLSGLRSNAATTVGGLGKVQRGRFSFGGIQGE